MTRSMAGASKGASGGLPIMIWWSSTIPSGLSTTWALPVGHLPVNWRPGVLPGLLLSSSGDRPQPRSTAARRGRPGRAEAQRRPLPPAKAGAAWRGGAKVTSHGRHLPIGHAGDDEGPACERPALPWCSEAVASGDVMVDRVVPTGCGRISLVRLSSRRDEAARWQAGTLVELAAGHRIDGRAGTRTPTLKPPAPAARPGRRGRAGCGGPAGPACEPPRSPPGGRRPGA